MKRIILVDDNPRDRSFLAEVLHQYDPIFTANANEALKVCESFQEPWIITDIQMPGCNGIEMGRNIWENKPMARILFCSQHSDETYVRALSKIIPAETVYGYVLKNNPAKIIAQSARAVFEECQCWIDPQIRSVQARTQRSCDALSDAEYEVLMDIALGLTDNAIAERYYLSRRGVQNRLKSLYAKLGANLEFYDNKNTTELTNTRSRAVAIALQRGLINVYELEKAEESFIDWLTKR